MLILILILVVMFVAVMILGFVPFLYLFASPFVVGLLNATVYMMYVMKVKKFGAITILGLFFWACNYYGRSPIFDNASYSYWHNCRFYS